MERTRGGPASRVREGLRPCCSRPAGGVRAARCGQRPRTSRVRTSGSRSDSVGRSPSSLGEGGREYSGKVIPLGAPGEMDRASFHRRDMVMLRRACLLSKSTMGEVAPFPFSGCVIVTKKNKVVAETFQYASGTEPAELQAVALAGEDRCKGSTLYVNLEPSYSLGLEEAVDAIVDAGVRRVVVGMENPLPHLKGQAIAALRGAGVQADCLRSHLASQTQDLEQKGLLLSESSFDALEEELVRTLKVCLETNENLLHCVARGRPLCVLKYAMTFDGKTASESGHSAWISGTQSRQLVYQQRAICDCVVVGGETARSDNPRLTTRRDEGHVPTRVVVTRSMDLPLECNLWDARGGPTLVITEEGVNPELQGKLRKKGVEVIEIEGLDLGKVVDHLYDRGFMRALWECGGVMAAPAISEGVINKVMAFVAPKIIGGTGAPTPVGDALGLTKMTDALDVTDVTYQQVDQDVLAVGYLPVTKSLFHLAKEAYDLPKPHHQCPGPPTDDEEEGMAVRFYKAWNEYGLLSNFFCVPLELDGDVWKSAEHYYQAMKFSNSCSIEAGLVMKEIAAQSSAEEAARVGRKMQASNPNLVRQDWDEAKLGIMGKALRVKFAVGTPAWRLLQSTCVEGLPACRLIEYSPRDSFWGEGFDGSGLNWLGTILMEIREETSEA